MARTEGMDDRARADAEAYFDDKGGMALLWFGVAAGPAAWFLHLNVSYSLVRLICFQGGNWLFHVTTLVTLVLAGAGVAAAWKSFQRLGRPELTKGEGTIGRSRLMAVGGLGLSGFFLLIIMLAWIPDFILDPCPGGL